MKFIDQVQLQVASGRGGAGAVSFRREKFVPRGGPDGGNGGRGGHVIFRVNPRIHSLLEFRYKTQLKAGDGQPGSGQNSSGAQGEDLILDVPPGTLIRDAHGAVVKDLGEGAEGDFELLAGGRGGKGNSFFKTSVQQVPHHAQPGEPGKTLDIQLELKVLADVGLLGFPNAGKSTLIGAISAARPKVADYPFTTLTPQLGVVEIEGDSFVVADLPGLIEGAHQGVGLGNQFLRHLERTRIFLHLVDCSGWEGQNPTEDYGKIRDELSAYDEKNKEDLDLFGGPLSDRPHIVVLSKADLVSEQQRDQMVREFENMGLDPFLVSAATGWQVRELKLKVKQLLDKARSE